jgi:hypothetical protein
MSRLLARLRGLAVIVVCLGLGAACTNSDSDVSSAWILNDTTSSVTVIHCLDVCPAAIDKGTIRPGKAFETNIASGNGKELYLIFSSSRGPFECLYAAYSGGGGATVIYKVSEAHSISAEEDCRRSGSTVTVPGTAQPRS